MTTVNGTLKYFGPTKDGDKATLTADWEDGEKKKWVSWAEAKPLRDARVVFKSSETWEDGKPKWKVDGSPLVSVTTTFNGKGVPPTSIVFVGNGTEPAATPDEPNTFTPASWDQLERDLVVSFAVASRVWKKMMEGGLPDDATLQATAATVFIEANKKGLHGTPIELVDEAPKAVGGFDDVPAGVVDEEDDDLPF